MLWRGMEDESSSVTQITGLKTRAVPHTDLHWDIDVRSRWPLSACAVQSWHFTISAGAKCQPFVLVLGRFGLWEWSWFSPVRRVGTSSFSWVITRDLVWNQLSSLFIRGISAEHENVVILKKWTELFTLCNFRALKHHCPKSLVAFYLKLDIIIFHKCSSRTDDNLTD